MQSVTFAMGIVVYNWVGANKQYNQLNLEYLNAVDKTCSTM